MSIFATSCPLVRVRTSGRGARRRFWSCRMTTAPDAPHGRPAISRSLPLASVPALGIVFGDIGTSPLYTLKNVLGLDGENPDPQVIFGSLSLVIWTLIVVTTIKYVSVAMRVDNDG